VPTDDEKVAPGRIVAAVIFAVLALAFFGITLYYLASSHHSLRGVGSFVAGLAFVGASWFSLRYRSLALEEAREADRAAARAEAEAEQAAAGLVGTVVQARTVPANPRPANPGQANPGQAGAGQATEA
jgi:hypothetical protein